MTLPANFTARTLVMPTPCIVWMGALNAKGYRREYYARRKAS